MDNILIFGIWILISFLDSNVAKRKGRSRLFWFFTVLITSLNRTDKRNKKTKLLKTYKRLTVLEKFIPLIFFILYLCLILYSLIGF